MYVNIGRGVSIERERGCGSVAYCLPHHPLGERFSSVGTDHLSGNNPRFHRIDVGGWQREGWLPEDVI